MRNVVGAGGWLFLYQPIGVLAGNGGHVHGVAAALPPHRPQDAGGDPQATPALHNGRGRDGVCQALGFFEGFHQIKRHRTRRISEGGKTDHVADVSTALNVNSVAAC